MPPLINIAWGIDHIIIRCPNAAQTQEMFVQHLGIPTMLPVKDFGHYQSGLVRLGNLDIEFLSIGTDQPSEPVFYGIALMSNLDVWETARWLKASKIEHSLSVKACAIQRNQAYCQTVTLLKGFLANPLKAPYLKGLFAGGNILVRAASSIVNTLMRFPSVRAVSAKEARGSMTLFCHYHSNMDVFRLPADEELKQLNGGTYRITRVREIIVLVNSTKNNWSKLLSQSVLEASPQLKLLFGAFDQISEVVIESNMIPPAPLQLGKAKFSFVGTVDTR